MRLPNDTALADLLRANPALRVAATAGSPLDLKMANQGCHRMAPVRDTTSEKLAPASKYGAVRTEGPDPAGGTRVYDSKAGAALARRLDAEKRAGLILDWFEEPSIPVGIDEQARKVRYRADAMILGGTTDDGWLKVRFVDRKRGSHDTDTSRAKRAALRGRGLNVEIVTA